MSDPLTLTRGRKGYLVEGGKYTLFGAGILLIGILGFDQASTMEGFWWKLIDWIISGVALLLGTIGVLVYGAELLRGLSGKAAPTLLLQVDDDGITFPDQFTIPWELVDHLECRFRGSYRIGRRLEIHFRKPEKGAALYPLYEQITKKSGDNAFANIEVLAVDRPSAREFFDSLHIRLNAERRRMGRDPKEAKKDMWGTGYYADMLR